MAPPLCQTIVAAAVLLALDGWVAPVCCEARREKQAMRKVVAVRLPRRAGPLDRLRQAIASNLPSGDADIIG